MESKEQGKQAEETGMRNFITLSKTVRREYNEKIPFIAALCKLPQREDVKTMIQKYLDYKNSLKALTNGK